MKQAAKVFSVVFHPLLMPTYLLVVIFNSYSYLSFGFSKDAKLFLILYVFFFLFLTPGLLSLILLRNGVISSLSMRTKKERLYPYVISVIMMSIVLYSFTRKSMPHDIFLFFMGALTSLCVLTSINFFWLVSAHMTGIGGLIGALIALQLKLNTDLSVYFLMAILTAGIIGSSRLTLRAHTPMQLFAGLVIGLVPQIYILIF